MIRKVVLHNFKSFKHEEIPARRLNLLMGLNGSGKSSFIQALLLLKYNQSPLFESSKVDLSRSELNIGRLRDLFYCYGNTQEPVSISIELGTAEETQHGCCFFIPFTDPDADVVDLNLSLSAELRGGWNVGSAQYVSSIQFVSAHRLPPMSLHTYSSWCVGQKEWGNGGENVVAYLSEHAEDAVDERVCRPEERGRTLLQQVNAWLGVICPGVHIQADELRNIGRAVLSIGIEDRVRVAAFKPQNVGFGISNVLPIVVMLLASRPDECLIMENPEVHLHPLGQSELGRLLALTAARGVQLFVETHSDHIVNGIRVSVKRKDLRPDEAIVDYFSIKPQLTETGVLIEQTSDIVRLQFMENGELSDYPDGFLDEWTRRLIELVSR